MASDLFGFGFVLTLGVSLVLLSSISRTKTARTFTLTPKSTHPISSNGGSAEPELAALQQQCHRLREELQQQKAQLTADLQEATFEQLQSLLTNYPTAQKMAAIKPDLPAKNLTSLFTPLETLLQDWQIEPIGLPWELVPYNSQLHQPDADDIAENEPVYIRFVGYRQGERILCPAKVSRTLPIAYDHDRH
jgi:molecular chaperone GrpE (heat shock protein)